MCREKITVSKAGGDTWDGGRQYKTYLNSISKSKSELREKGLLINMFFYGYEEEKSLNMGATASCPWCPHQLQCKGNKGAERIKNKA